MALSTRSLGQGLGGPPLADPPFSGRPSPAPRFFLGRRFRPHTGAVVWHACARLENGAGASASRARYVGTSSDPAGGTRKLSEAPVFRARVMHCVEEE